LKRDGTRAETRFGLSAKRMSPFKSAGASVQSTTGSRGVRSSGSNAGYTMLRGSVKGTGYPLHSHVSRSPPLPCVTVCHHISTELYLCRVCNKQKSGQLTIFMRGGGWEVEDKVCNPSHNEKVLLFRYYYYNHYSEATHQSLQSLSPHLQSLLTHNLPHPLLLLVDVRLTAVPHMCMFSPTVGKSNGVNAFL